MKAKQKKHEPEPIIKPEELAARLKSLRKDAGKSIADMTRDAGISRTGVIKMESPRSNPMIGTVAAYVTACGKTLSEFFVPWKRPASDRR